MIRERLAGYVERREVPGLVALVADGDDARVEVLGTPALDDPTPLRRDAVFRIASLTKPITAAAAMTLVEDGRLALHAPVETYLPELADRRVLRAVDGPLDDTVPAERSITVEDLLTNRLGFGSIVEVPPGSWPIQRAEAELGLATLTAPWPPPPLDSEQWLARFAGLPLMEQPGAAWRYNTGSQLLGVLLERVTGAPLFELMRERLFEPLGMVDTGFTVPPAAQPRLTTAYRRGPDGGLEVLDPPSGGWWNTPQPMQNGAGMLVSTVDDVWAFARMLRAGGGRVLSPASVAAMTRDHLTAAQRAANRLLLGPYDGWGYGMAAPGPLSGEPPIPWGYGWNGGTGTAWRTDPVRDLTTVLLTQVAMDSPQPPPVFTDFWDAAYATAR